MGARETLTRYRQLYRDARRLESNHGSAALIASMRAEAAGLEQEVQRLLGYCRDDTAHNALLLYYCLGMSEMDAAEEVGICDRTLRRMRKDFFERAEKSA